MSRRLAITFDYRCAFARVAHLHALDALEAGLDATVDFVPLSLIQLKVEAGAPTVWDDPSLDSGLLALQVGVAVRDAQPDAFAAVHRGIFDARHAAGRDVRDRDVLVDVLEAAGADAGAALDHVDRGDALATIRDEHERAVREHDVWGVPTFIADGRAAFVRLMDPPVDGADARRTVERVLDLVVGWPALNELKHTTTDR